MPLSPSIPGAQTTNLFTQTRSTLHLPYQRNRSIYMAPYQGLLRLQGSRSTHRAPRFQPCRTTHPAQSQILTSALNLAPTGFLQTQHISDMIQIQQRTILSSKSLPIFVSLRLVVAAVRYTPTFMHRIPSRLAPSPVGTLQRV